MVAVDSSGWIEFLAGGPKAAAYARHLRDPQRVITPVVVVYEVFKKLKRERGEDVALLCLAQLEKTVIVDLTREMALAAADLSLEFSLPMADAFVLAAARAMNVPLITSDTDFRGVPGAQVV